MIWVLSRILRERERERERDRKKDFCYVICYSNIVALNWETVLFIGPMTLTASLAVSCFPWG